MSEKSRRDKELGVAVEFFFFSVVCDSPVFIGVTADGSSAEKSNPLKNRLAGFGEQG